jgi:hypothetical protein
MVVSAMVGTVAGCGRGSSDASATASAGGSVEAKGGAGKVLPAAPNLCEIVKADEAARLIGPLARAPWQARAADDTESTREGHACVYPLAARDRYGDVADVRVELLTEGAGGVETAIGMVGGILAKQMGPGIVRTADAAKPASARDSAEEAQQAGWDYLGQLGPEIQGRVGGMELHARWDEAPVKRDSIVKLVTLFRDRIPDLPFASERTNTAYDGDGDACSLLTRAEAEAVLGPLAMPPYHSRDDTPLADPGGGGCAFFTGRHRALVIHPTWSQAKVLFPMLAGMRQTFESKTGAPSAASDTLEGPWDQAGSSLAGTLYFLKGDRMLAVSYQNSRTDLKGALKLASQAVTRLASK